MTLDKKRLNERYKQSVTRGVQKKVVFAFRGGSVAGYENTLLWCNIPQQSQLYSTPTLHPPASISWWTRRNWLFEGLDDDCPLLSSYYRKHPSLVGNTQQQGNINDIGSPRRKKTRERKNRHLVTHRRDSTVSAVQVFEIREILVRIRLHIQVFHQWPFNTPTKNIFFLSSFFLLIIFEGTFTTTFFKDKQS